MTFLICSTTSVRLITFLFNKQKDHIYYTPLSLYLFLIGINQKQKEYIIAIYQCFTLFFKTDDEFLFSLNRVNFVTLFATILLL